MSFESKFIKRSWIFIIVFLACTGLLLCSGFYSSTTHEIEKSKTEKILNLSSGQSNYFHTTPANVKEEYNQWELPSSFLESFWMFIQNTPMDESGERHRFMLTVVNSGMVHYAKNWYCSLLKTDTPKNSYVIVATDVEAYENLVKFGAPTLYCKTNFTKDAVNNNKIIKFYDIVKLRPTILHQALLWGAEAILSDVDIVFFSNPFKLFKGKSDFEVQSDCKVNYTIPVNESNTIWRVNLGFYMVRPTPQVMELMPTWMVSMYQSPKLVDQKALKNILKKKQSSYLGDDSMTFKWSETSNITIRYLDPMLAVNAGGALKDGKEKWKAEAKRRNLKEPVLIHFFHIGSNKEKLYLMTTNNMFLHNKNKCNKNGPKWDIWK